MLHLIEGFERSPKAHFIILKRIKMGLDDFVNSFQQTQKPDSHPGYGKICRDSLTLLEELFDLLTIIVIPEEDEIEFRNKLREMEQEYQEYINRSDLLLNHIGIIFDYLPREKNPY